MPVVCLKQFKFQKAPAYLVFIVYSSGLNQTVYLGGLNKAVVITTRGASIRKSS
jgi:hypothetical protein